MLAAFRQFVLVCDHGTVTEAARRAHLSQPAVTAALKRLEEELGARLLDRDRAGARPTAAGRALLVHARAALAAVEDGRRAVEELTGLRAGEVRLGGGATSVTYYLPPLLAAFRKANPGILLRVRELAAPDAEDAFAAGQLDLAIVTSPDAEPWLDEVLVLVASPRLDPRGASFVTFPAGTSTRSLLARHLPDARIGVEVSGIAAVLEHVEAGMGIALVSRAAAARRIAAGRLVEVPHPATPIARVLGIRHAGVERLSPAAAALRLLLLGVATARTPASRSRRRRARPRPRP